MNKKYISTAILLLITLTSYGQFHTLNYPQISPKVVESQKLGVTKITIAYSSPALRGRDVWNNEIPKKGDPIAWRAGANLATTIEFTTDVKIEGQELKAGIYGFYVIPDNDTHTLLFAHNYQQWGSYYLDKEKDISLKVEVNSVSCVKSEQLDFEFLNRTENSLIIGLEWDEKRIPFKIEVDLNKTVIESFRKELRGINTNRWEAWDDAALWCLNHDTNLEEALEWANRSINGGFNGFGSNKNLKNLGTKINILKKLNRTTELNSTIEEVITLADQTISGQKNFTTMSAKAQLLAQFGKGDESTKVIKEALKLPSAAEGDYYGYGRQLIGQDKDDEALKIFTAMKKKWPDHWLSIHGLARAHSAKGDYKKALKYEREALAKAPAESKGFLEGYIKTLESGKDFN